MLATANTSLVNILVANIFTMAAGVVDTVKIFLLSTSLCKILLLFLILCARVEGHTNFSDARVCTLQFSHPWKQASSTCVMVPNLVVYAKPCGQENTKNWGY